jgi:hypothetical protein
MLASREEAVDFFPIPFLTSAEHSAKVNRITDIVGKIFNESGDKVEQIICH